MSANVDAALDALVELVADKIAGRLLGMLQAHEREVGQSSESRWMSVASAAAYLDWPRQRLYKLTAQGAIPHYKHEGRLLFHRQELDQWLAGFRQPSDWMNGGNRAISR